MTTLFSLRPSTPNIGNDIIGLATDAVLRAVFGDHVCLVSLPLDDSGMKGGGLTARSLYQINQIADGLIIGPGNLFENGALQVDLNALAALSVSTMLLSVSMGRVFARTGELTLRTDSLPADVMVRLCRACEPALVRDLATAAHLSCHNFVQSEIVSCPSFFMDRIPLSLPARDPGLSDTVLLSIRHPDHMSIPSSRRGRLTVDLGRIVDRFRKRDIPVRLLCHDFRDLDFVQSFRDVPMMYTEDPYRFLAWLRYCKLNVTFRLHAFLSCVALGVPSIPLTYDERSISSIETIGLKDWAIDYIRAGDFLSELEKRYENPSCLDEMKQAARPLWDVLYKRLIDGIARFAQKVETTRKSRVF